MINRRFYTPDEARRLYDEIIPAYQSAFAGWPWNEVSKCVDDRQRCVGGMSKIAVGTLCGVCKGAPSEPAYRSDELVDRFDKIAETKQAAWYAELGQKGLNMAALAWRTPWSLIASEKYSNDPDMADWMSQRLPGGDVIWLDEVFANRQISSKGNLRNFGEFVSGFSDRLGGSTVAYRTISQQMVKAAERDFADQATIYRAKDGQVPDRRDFIVINTGEGK